MGFGKVELIKAPYKTKYETSLLFLLASLRVEMLITL